MNETVAKVLLRKLSKYFKEPVKPVSKYCLSLETWANLMENNFYLKKQKNPAYLGRGYEEHIRKILLDIGKSNLLWRLIYCDLPVRQTPCPFHKGKWSGCFGECEHSCGLTGWLPEESELLSLQDEEISFLDIKETRAKITVDQLLKWLKKNDWYHKEKYDGNFWSLNCAENKEGKNFFLPKENCDNSRIEDAVYFVVERTGKTCVEVIKEIQDL